MERDFIKVNDIPTENIAILGRLLFEVASKWFSKPENMQQYEKDCCQKAASQEVFYEKED